MVEVVYVQRASKSAQSLELQHVPQPAYLDEDVAKIASDQQDDEKSPELDGVADGTRPNGTASGLMAHDPERNPNLKQIQSQHSMRSLGRGVSLMDGMYRSTSTISIVGDGMQQVTGIGMHSMSPQLEGDEMKNDGDRALDMIAGKSSISTVNGQGKAENEEEPLEVSESDLMYGDLHQKTVEGGRSDGDESMEFDEDGGIYSV